MNPHILLIEDDTAIAEMMLKALTKEGYKLTTASDGVEGLLAFACHTYDLVLVDLMMPKVDGMEVIRRIRTSSAVPILIMSAKDSDVDKALGLGFGADDYVAKPFSMLEMTARIQSAIRRSTTYARQQRQEEQPKAQILSYGNLHIDFDHFTVIRNKNEIQLTAKESDILKLFVTNPNRVFTKAQLYGFIWKEDYMGDENVINVHIRRLREKIEEDPSHPIHIKTLWGIGYKWENG